MKFGLFLFATSQGIIFEIFQNILCEKIKIEVPNFSKITEKGRGLTFSNDYDDYNATADGGYYDYHDYDASDFERGTSGSRKYSETPSDFIVLIKAHLTILIG